MCTRTESNGYPEKRSACASLYNYFVEKRLIRSIGDSRVVSPRFPLYLLFPLVGTTTVFENNNIQRIENKEAKLSLIFRPEIGRKNIIIRSFRFRILFSKKIIISRQFLRSSAPRLN